MGLSTIRRGSVGPDVATWQKILGVSPDSSFGPATEAATKVWQAERGLIADGVVGPATWGAAGVSQTEPPPSTGTIPYVPAKHFTRASRGAQQITAIVIHTAECGETERAAENLQSWTAGPNASKASWHYAVDPNSVTQSVRDEDIAWHAGPANDWSLGIEHAGYASQTTAQWADEASTKILLRSAELVAGLCARWGIPVKRLTAEDLARGERRGIFGHVDVTNGLTKGVGHQDPGRFFPWSQYLALVQSNLDALSHVDIASDTERAPAAQGSDAPPLARLATTPDGFVEVEYAGETWLVQPLPSAFCSIGEAVDAAKRANCELPSPGLVDAIWRAADLRITPAPQRTDRTNAGMNAPEVYARITKALEAALSGRVVGEDVRLVAGLWKEIAMKGGKPGLYGWHAESPGDVAGVRLHAPETPGPGLVIQPFYGGHALAHRDYSQAFRLVRRKT